MILHYLFGTFVMLLLTSGAWGPPLLSDYLDRREKKRRALKKAQKKEKKRLKQSAAL
jgi:hypothetical protein